jgi:hypothetical protein
MALQVPELRLRVDVHTAKRETEALRQLPAVQDNVLARQTLRAVL